MADARRAALGGARRGGRRRRGTGALSYEVARSQLALRRGRARPGGAQRADGAVIVFCEVKTRASARFGSPFEAVTPAKQRRLRTPGGAVAAPAPAAARRATSTIRFDVAAVTGRTGGALEVEVLEDAF